MYEKLGIDLDKGYQSIVRSSTGENMGVLGQVTFTFKINDTTFTQSFIVCRQMTRHMILTDFTATNFVGVIWTREGMQKLMHSNGKTIIGLPDSTSGVPLVLGYSVEIHPGDHLTVPLECTRPVTDRMDIRTDIRFHHRNPSVYIPPSFVNNPKYKYNPKYMPLTIFNISKVDHQYTGRNTIIAFANVPEFETYNVEIASEDKIKEHLAKPRNWVPKHCLKFHLILLSFVLQQMYLDITRFTCRTRKSLVIFTRGLKNYVRSMDRHFHNIMRTLPEQSLSKWM